MAITYEILEHHGLCLMRASGPLTLEDYLENADALLSDPEYRTCRADLLDLRQIEAVQLSAADIETIVRKDQEFGDMLKRRKLAIVANSDVSFGFARMYSAHSNSTFSGLHVFRDMDTALEWLGIEPT